MPFPAPCCSAAAASSSRVRAISKRRCGCMDERDRAIVNALQGGFPLCERPYRAAAASLGMSEEELIARLGALLESGVLTRFGPMFQAERMGGAFLLAALRVPEPDYERVAACVNAAPEVAHNYRREHEFNMWFVLAAQDGARIDAAIARIEAQTGLALYAFPKLKEYFVGMKLDA
ncbi:MAG TPA: AsnC family protein [Rhodocyclaceae bacterium]|nr:MAG: AsnC family protein [Rhodocyclales bacterium CG_4_9_14_3_um_filter_68_10]HCX33605.1 AsnC family protein [Rhodocyclaceae bacterium]